MNSIDNSDIQANFKSHHFSCNKTSEKIYDYNPEEKVLIVGIDNVDRAEVYRAEKILKDFFKFRTTVVIKNTTIEDKFHYNGDPEIIDGNALVTSFKSENKVLMVTDKKMIGQGIWVRGLSSYSNKLLITETGKFMKETIIHEMGHSYGLSHCGNLSCVMAIYNDEYDTGKFCEECSKSINFYR
ncbi:MAG: hypothetical protein ACK5D5_04135 [Bacteroidota bacterium]